PGESDLPSCAAFRRAAIAAAVATVGAWAAPLAQARPPQKQTVPSMKSALTYKPLTFAQVPDWDQDDHLAAFKAFLKSCDRVLSTARERAAGDKPVPPPSLVAACAAAGKAGTLTKAGAKAFFEQHFTANAVTHS